MIDFIVEFLFRLLFREINFSIRIILAYAAIIIMVYEIERVYRFNINNLYLN